MNFINKYQNGEISSAYRYAEEFMETDIRTGVTIPVIYSVGSLGEMPLITKTDSDGNLLWEHTYSLGKNLSGMSFHKIIRSYNPAPLPKEKQDGGPALVSTADEEAAMPLPMDETIYVLYATNGVKRFLVGISASGQVFWCKLVVWDDNSSVFYIEPSLQDSSFYLVIANNYESSSAAYPIVAKYDWYGSFQQAVMILSDGKYFVNAVHSHPGGLILGGTYSELIDTGLFIDINSSLGINFNRRIEGVSLQVQDVKYSNNGYFLYSGRVTDNGFLFASAFDANAAVFPLYLFKNSEGFTRVCPAIEQFYVLQYTNSEGSVHLMNPDFSQVWKKTLQLNTGPNGINKLNFLPDTFSCTFNVAEYGTHNLLAHTDSGLGSCKTVTETKPILEAWEYSLKSIKLSLKNTLLESSDVGVKITVNEPITIECCSGSGDEVPLDETALLQSPNFYIQAAGSTGADGSATGIHLRWIFAGRLGEKHLPKGDYAATSYNFNKPDDYVRLYRAPYIKAQVMLNFSNPPYLADDSNKVWLYRIGSRVFYVYFRNAVKYTMARASFNPFADPSGFMQAYGNELIEIENKKELFFAAEIVLKGAGINASLKTETLSVSENALGVSKVLSSRKTYSGAALGNVRLVCENGRSIRLRPSGCGFQHILFECYSDFINDTNSRRGWLALDKYALTIDDGAAFTRLEPSPGLVDGKWQRFNDNAFVNIANYQNKWNGARESWDRNIKGVVQQYISLSNAQANPRALENVPMQSGGSAPGDDNLEISNLDLLNVAAYDFHIARILGLGTLDVSDTTGATFVYIAVYTTTGDLEDGGGARTVKHLAMSIPVSINQQRLPLPVKIKEIKPGAFWGTESPDPVNLTDANGYTQDGRMRYVTLYNEQLPEDELNKPFYYTSREFNAAEITYPVYAGLEYKRDNDPQWVKPELPNDPKFQNKVPTGQQPHNETIPLMLPDAQKPLFVHRQRISGTHYYGSYGINWFSRAASSTTVLSILTNIQPLNPLKPPTNINALLVRQEMPLIFSTGIEQDRYAHITGDHTLVKLSFDYHTYQELINYKIPLGANINDPNIIPADSSEIFADKVEVFFRNQVPGNVSGKVLSITDHPTNNLLSVIQTGNYIMTSVNQVLQPVIPASAVANYTGGLFIIDDQQFIIHQVVLPTGSMQGPQFTVYKKEISNGLVTNEIPAAGTQNLEAPVNVPDGLFMAVENMQNPGSWNTPNPLPLTVNIGTGWAINREVVTISNDDGTTEQHLEKARGFWDTADIQPVLEPVEQPSGPPLQQHRGLYKITFQNLVLAEHAQYQQYGPSVEWYQGIIRVHTQLHPLARRKTLQVLRLENVFRPGDTTSNKLVLYASDASFVDTTGYDKIATGIVSVNFYPGYKTYHYANAGYGLTEAAILPAANEDVRYSIFGLRSHDLQGNFYSKISVPQLMFAQQQVEPVAPEQPVGSLYATRPDFFGRSTYTFTTKYAHRPHGVLTCRADDEILLNTLYKPETVITIRQQLAAFGGSEDPFFANRWKNFLDFTALAQNNDYLAYPAGDPDAYKFPHPDKTEFFTWLNAILQERGDPQVTEAPGVLAAGDDKIIEFVQRAIGNAFVPLTEIPVIYQYINGANYKPVPKKQVIRDRNGNVLKPGDTGFDMAPMMRITGGPNDETAFTDFTLDGASSNNYFYGVRELNAQLKMSAFSPFLGPVKLVNTHPPVAPEIKRIMPVLNNMAFGTSAGIQIEVNAYPEVQRVRKLNIYRAVNQLDAQSVRSMKLVKTVDLDDSGILADDIWLVKDKFEDLAEIPYNDGLFYRITASRKIEYADMDGNVITEYAPSQPSKLVATLVSESDNPPAPVLSWVSDPITPQGVLNNVVLEWDKTAYKAKYHLYIMNSSGNWLKIHELASNDAHMVLPLANTGLQSGTIATKDANGNNLYTHFKVVTENTSGMLSLEEQILTIG